MTVLQEISNPYIASIVLGLIYGLTFCATACLPYIISYIAGVGAGFKKGIAITSIYNSGRIVAYAIIGTVVGLVSAALTEDFFSLYQQYSSIAFGIIIIFIGTTILLKKQKKECSFKEQNFDHFGISKIISKIDLKAFAMGFTRGFILCPPLIAILLYAATFSPFDCTILAVLFGLGTALSPILVLGGATGYLLKKAPLFSNWLSRIGAIALIVMGLSVLISSFMELI
jgi:sulfite exporter TauE/SafE